MSGEFEDDAFGGTGKPTKEQVIAVRDYLKRHNRNHSTRKVRMELVARGFTVSIAKVGRDLRGIAGGIPPNVKSELAEVTERARKRRDPRPSHTKAGETEAKGKANPSPLSGINTMLEDATLVPAIADLLKAETSSTQLAIDENRVRMALNIVIMKRMAATPGLLLLDMRGTAALVDAFTVGAKLSGGASIDILIPAGPKLNGAGGGMNGNGHDMVDITPVPQTQLAADLDAFRRRKAAEDAKRA